MAGGIEQRQAAIGYPYGCPWRALCWRCAGREGARSVAAVLPGRVAGGVAFCAR